MLLYHGAITQYEMNTSYLGSFKIYVFIHTFVNCFVLNYCDKNIEQKPINVKKINDRN